MPRTGAPNGIVDEWEGVPPADAFVNGGHVGLTIPMLIVERLTRVVYARDSSGVVVAVGIGEAYTKAESDARYYTKAQADALFLDQTEGDARYAPIAGVAGAWSVGGLLSANGGLLINGGAFAAGRIYKSAVDGLAIAGIVGATYDLALYTPLGSYVMRVPTGTQTAVFPSDVISLSQMTSLVINLTDSTPIRLNYNGNNDIWMKGAVSTLRVMNTTDSLVNLSLDQTGNLAVRGSFTLQPTQRLWLDGGTDTWIYEGSANTINFVVNGNHGIMVDDTAPTSTDLRLSIGRGGGVGLSRCSLGAADSGGAGFRVVRVPN